MTACHSNGTSELVNSGLTVKKQQLGSVVVEEAVLR